MKNVIFIIISIFAVGCYDSVDLDTDTEYSTDNYESVAEVDSDTNVEVTSDTIMTTDSESESDSIVMCSYNYACDSDVILKCDYSSGKLDKYKDCSLEGDKTCGTVGGLVVCLPKTHNECYKNDIAYPDGYAECVDSDDLPQPSKYIRCSNGEWYGYNCSINTYCHQDTDYLGDIKCVQ
jgi:hypothetical protein